MPRKTIIAIALVAFLGSSIQMPACAQIDPMPFMPAPGTIVPLSPEFTPAYLKGIVIHPKDPFKFDFIIYKGDKSLTYVQKKEEYTKLTKYFLASLAIPDDDQWVNLSPYEKDRIIKDDFGRTEMGRDLLTQDYLLKQITASLIYPESKLGQEFWKKVYAQAQKQYGTTDIPVNTFNKVWILPDDALIYEKGNNTPSLPLTAYVLKNHLRVMMEEDYLSLAKHQGQPGDMSPGRLPSKEALNVKATQGNHGIDTPSHSMASNIIRQIVLPELQKEVNEDANFAPLRQVYSGMLLATWFKRTLKQSLLGQIYANKAKVRGVDQDPRTNEKIYQQYLKAYKKGVFNFIKEDMDRLTGETMPRKYFSGGELNSYPYVLRVTNRATMAQDKAMESVEKELDFATVATAMIGQDGVMNSRQVQEHITRAYWALHRVRQIELKVGKNAGNVVNELLKEARDQIVQLVPLHEDRVWKLWAYLMNSGIELTDDQEWKTVYESLEELNDRRPLAEPGEYDVKLNSETESQELSMRRLSVTMHFKQARVILPGPEKQQVTIRRESQGVYFIDPFKLSRGGVEIKSHGSDQGFMFGIQKSNGRFVLINEVKRSKIEVRVDGRLIDGENDKYGVLFTPELPPQGANIDITFSRLSIHLRFQGRALFLREAFKIPVKKDIVFIIGGENVLQIDLPFVNYDNLGFLSFADHPLQLFYTPFDAAMKADEGMKKQNSWPLKIRHWAAQFISYGFWEELIHAIAVRGQVKNSAKQWQGKQIDVIGHYHTNSADSLNFYQFFVRFSFSNVEDQKPSIRFIQKILSDRTLKDYRKSVRLIRVWAKENSSGVIAREGSPRILEQDRILMKRFSARVRQILGFLRIDERKAGDIVLLVWGPVMYAEFFNLIGDVKVVAIEEESLHSRSFKISGELNNVLSEFLESFKPNIDLRDALDFLQKTRKSISYDQDELRRIEEGWDSRQRDLFDTTLKLVTEQEVNYRRREAAIMKNLEKIDSKNILVVIGGNHVAGLQKLTQGHLNVLRKVKVANFAMITTARGGQGIGKANAAMKAEEGKVMLSAKLKKGDNVREKASGAYGQIAGFSDHRQQIYIHFDRDKGLTAFSMTGIGKKLDFVSGGSFVLPIIDVAIKNPAMMADYGGIDLNSANLNLRIKRDGNGVRLPLAQQGLAQLANIQGLDPVILSITPASQTPFFVQLLAH